MPLPEVTDRFFEAIGMETMLRKRSLTFKYVDVLYDGFVERPVARAYLAIALLDEGSPKRVYGDVKEMLAGCDPRPYSPSAFYDSVYGGLKRRIEDFQKVNQLNYDDRFLRFVAWESTVNYKSNSGKVVELVAARSKVARELCDYVDSGAPMDSPKMLRIKERIMDAMLNCKETKFKGSTVAKSMETMYKLADSYRSLYYIELR
jgi:hypothetical protein